MDSVAGSVACRIRNQGKPFLLLQNPTNDWNPDNKLHQQKHVQYMESAIQGVASRIQQYLGLPQKG